MTKENKDPLDYLKSSLLWVPMHPHAKEKIFEALEELEEQLKNSVPKREEEDEN